MFKPLIVNHTTHTFESQEHKAISKGQYSDQEINSLLAEPGSTQIIFKTRKAETIMAMICSCIWQIKLPLRIPFAPSFSSKFGNRVGSFNTFPTSRKKI